MTVVPAEFEPVANAREHLRHVTFERLRSLEQARAGAATLSGGDQVLTEPPRRSGFLPDPVQVLQATVELARESNRRQRLEGIAESVARLSARLVGADQATVGVSRDGEVVTVAALYPRRLPIGSHFPIGYGVAGWVAATGRAAEIADVRHDRRYVPLEYPEVRSFLGLPLETDGDLVGVVSLSAWEPNAFPPGLAAALAPFAEHVALILRRAEAEEELRSQVALLEEQVHGPVADSLHELKSPLQSVLGFLEVMSDERFGPVAERQRELLQSAFAEGRRLRDGLAALIEASAAGERPFTARSHVCPRDLAMAAVERVRGTAQMKDIAIRLDMPEDCGEQVLVDSAAIQQVLSNLLNNALRQSPRGAVLQLSVIEEPGWVCFVVNDRGTGLGDGNSERLFDRFAQGGAQADRQPGDVGLGLWLSRRIVEQHGGLIWAENNEGAGSRFTFALPSAEA